MEELTMTELIARSSFGTPEALARRRRTPPEVVAAITERLTEIPGDDAGFPYARPMTLRPFEEIVGTLYGRDGAPITFEQFAHLKFDGDDDIVGRTDHGDTTISTVWLGWSEGFDDQGRPIIFETALMTAEGVDILMRYATAAEAAAVHRVIVGCLRITQPLPALPPGR